MDESEDGVATFEGELEGEEAAELILEVETIIEGIKNGTIEGEYFEF